MTQQKLPPETSPRTFRGGRVSPKISQEIQTGINPEKTGVTSTKIQRHIKYHLGTSLGKDTGTSITLEIHIESSLEVTQGTLGTSQEAVIEASIIRKMIIGISKEITTGITTEPLQETSPGTFKGVTIPETPQGETQECSIETHLETDMREEDRKREATALEITEIEGMITGEGMPAMGADVERVSRSP